MACFTWLVFRAAVKKSVLFQGIWLLSLVCWLFMVLSIFHFECYGGSVIGVLMSICVLGGVALWLYSHWSFW